MARAINFHFIPSALFRTSRFLLLLLPIAFTSIDANAQAPFELKDGDRVLFIGDTFFEREVTYGEIETRLTAAFPRSGVLFRNLAWSADTPLGESRASFDWNKGESNWLARVKEEVALVKPTVAFLSYGMTASLGEESALPKFKADLGRLMDAIKETSGEDVRFVLLSPVYRQDGPAGDAHRARLEATRQTIAALAKERSARYIDVHNISERIARSRVVAYDNPILLNERGYRMLAQRLLPALGLPAPNEFSTADDLLNEAIRKKNELFFNRWRPENWTYLFGFRKHEQGQNSVEIPKFDPLIAEWDQTVAALKDLKSQNPDAAAKVQALVNARKNPNPAATTPAKPQPIPTFEVADGFTATLWAENPSLHKPIGMNWDSQGRLWVASSEVYPQIKPGQPPTDSVVVLEDADGNGTAEKSTVFAGGLLIPTGVLPDETGGCYVAASHELLYFPDNDGDGKADERRIAMTSFGTEDTHHNLHALRWGFDGHIYMNQSIYTHSHMETPNGVVRLKSGGVLRFDPAALQMEIFTKGLVNSWGHHWDAYGTSFQTDGAGVEGLYLCVPGAMYNTYAGARRILGSISPGNYPKFCSLEVVRSPQFPDDWQNDFITCDFRAHRVVRFKATEVGSTFQTREMPDLLRSTNVTFRPIDVKFGPDGALYIADWSNPIIQHGEVDFRDPRRDKEHGRIWRVAAKGRPPVARVDLARANASQLTEQLLSRSGYHQQEARRLLQIQALNGSRTAVRQTVNDWAQRQGTDEARLEAAWFAEGLGEVDWDKIQQLGASTNPNIRCPATRLAGYAYSHAETSGTNSAKVLGERRAAVLDLLGRLSKDAHPRVRLEAVRALARIPLPQAADLALGILDQPMDPTLDYALWLTINDLSEIWIGALQSGAWKTDGREKQLEFGLKAIEPSQASRVLSGLLAKHPLDRTGSGPWIELIGQAGTSAELQQLFQKVLENGFDDDASVRALNALAEAARLRKSKPSGDLADVGKIITDSRRSDRVRTQALRVAGNWKEIGNALPLVLQLAGEAKTSPALRTQAFETLRAVGGTNVADGIGKLISESNEAAVRRQAALALASIDLNKSLSALNESLKSLSTDAESLEFWRTLLQIKGAGKAIAESLPAAGVPEAAARAGMRTAREGGRNEMDLVLALAKASGLAADTQAFSTQLIQEIAGKADKDGDALRGELVYRRNDLACVTCHAIGGAGGKVGPDLTSIGASAPTDYLVESLVLPNAKIKEGFHAVSLTTKDGTEYIGTLVRETPQEIVLRNATGAEQAIAKADVDRRENAQNSLMPAGLLDPLSEREQLDLIKFLSQLGKPGNFDASRGGVARKWRLYTLVHTDMQLGEADKVWEKSLDDKMWAPVLSLVNGSLPRAIMEAANERQVYAGSLATVAATELSVAKPGTVSLRLDAQGPAELWIDGAKVGANGETRLELKPGSHRVLVRLDPKNMPESIRLATTEASFGLN